MVTTTDKLIKEIQDNQEWNNKFKRQEELEERMRGMGVERYWSKAEKAQETGQATQLAPVRRLLGVGIERLILGIEEFMRHCESGGAGRKHGAYRFLKLIEPEIAAVLTCRVVLDGIAKSDTVIPLARKVAGMIEDELAWRKFKEVDRVAHDEVVKREKRVSGHSYHFQRKVMKYNMNKRGIEADTWSATDQALVGGKLIELMATYTRLVALVTRTVGSRRQDVFVEATPETLAWLREESNRQSLLSPVYLPTIIPPRPWTSPLEGGYWTKRVRRLALVKTHSRAYLDELAEHDMPQVYDAVNAMQHTAWVINRPVFDVMSKLWEAGSTIANIPPSDPEELPIRPAFLVDNKPKELWSAEECEAFKNWKHAAADVHTRNARLGSSRIQFQRCLDIARTYLDEEELYFPHQLDFRGRAYAVPLFLNPQGCDEARGLLTFADAAAIRDQEAADWLAVHGANSYGYDSASLRERVQWVADREAQIFACAEDPYSNNFWADADSPWQFLAFCFEWSAFKAEGFGFLSSLPVAMDGSCNGLQNFSAMLRDPVGGAAVNLVPADRPADVYQVVADRVLVRVQQDASSSDEELAAIAKGWLKHGVTRSVTKRPVMTLAYGAKAYGFKNQVMAETVAPYLRRVGSEEFPWENTGYRAANYMGGLIWEEVGEVVVAARHAMDWLQGAAKAAASEGLPVRWSTPDGLVVLQAYPVMKTKRVLLTFNGGHHRLTLATGPTPQLDQQRQANGISPNWVHSCDAAHMRSTVRKCWGLGIRSFALVHDSYGTHAANAWALAKTLRAAFIEMYAEDVLSVFREDLQRQLPPGAELPPLPPTGDLELDRVADSLYFFA